MNKRDRFTEETMIEGAKAHFWFDTGGGKGNGPSPIDCTVTRVTRCYVTVRDEYGNVHRTRKDTALHNLRYGWIAS